MNNLFDKSQGYTMFTSLGTKSIIKLQNYLITIIKNLKSENVPQEEIDEMMLMFLNESAYNKLLKNL